MAGILIRDIECLVTDTEQPPLRNAWLHIEGPAIRAAGTGAPPHGPVDRVIDGRAHLFMPGLVNTHHHFFQALTRNLPLTQNAKLFDWIRLNFQIWRHLDPEMTYWSAKTVGVELMLSGCTTAVDHFYLHPRRYPDIVEEELRAIRELGLRFHLARGSMSLSMKGEMAGEDILQTDDDALRDSQRLVERFHDGARFAMTRICVGPCTPFLATETLYRESRKLADAYPAVHLHSHMAETRDEVRYCQERFGKRPFDFMEDVGWMDAKAFFAHCVYVDPAEIARFARSGAGCAHCPTSNMRLGSGIAPVVEMLRAGVKVGLGVDGSASNDSSHMLAEARQSLLSQRVRYSEKDMSAVDVLTMGTKRGAAAIGRDDIGTLEPGKAADLVGIRLDQIFYAGAMHDPVAAIVFCFTPRVDWTIINGEIRVERGEVRGVDVGEIVREQNRMAARLLASS